MNAFEQDIVNVAKKVKAEAEAVGDDAEKALAWVATNSGTITGLAALGGTGTASLAAVGMTLFKEVATFLENAGADAAVNGTSVPLTAAAVAQVKAATATIKSL